jgi:nuclear protein NHN1
MIKTQNSPQCLNVAFNYQLGEMKKRVSPPPRGDKKEKVSEKESAAAKMKSTRREELLKQLKAVEDAIARKKSKI